MNPAVKKIKIDQDDIGDARIRLRGALNDSIHLEEDYDAELPQRGRPSKKLLLAQQDTQRLLATLPEAKPDTSTLHTKVVKKYSLSKKKVALSMLQQKPHNESFVMKLFDRSLDLSKYTEQTSLYRICRAWMANQPRNPIISHYSKEEPIPIQREDNAKEVLDKLRKREIKFIVKMPLAHKTDMSPIPPPLAKDKEELEESRKLVGATKEELLTDHKKHWTKVRRSWNRHTTKYSQETCGLSFKILDKLNKGGVRLP